MTLASTPHGYVGFRTSRPDYSWLRAHALAVQSLPRPRSGFGENMNSPHSRMSAHIFFQNRVVCNAMKPLCAYENRFCFFLLGATYVHTHASIYAHTPMRTHTYAHTYIHTYGLGIPSYIHKQSHTYTNTYRNAGCKHIFSHERAHSHTHTHTDTLVYMHIHRMQHVFFHGQTH